MRLSFFSLSSLHAKAFEKAVRMQSVAPAHPRSFGDLPGLLQRFLLRRGCPDNSGPDHAVTTWHNAALRFSFGGRWQAIQCRQDNFFGVPVRLAFMKRYLLQILPLEGYDQYELGKGRMNIRLLKLFCLADVHGPEMDQSELVTLLAELILFPRYAFAPYIHWESTGDDVLKATINDRGISASGLFYFNKEADIIRFETDDRFYTLPGGTMVKMPWVAATEAFHVSAGINSPAKFTATWIRPDGPWTYFKGDLAEPEATVIDS